jgi:DNA-binding MarR family transcriptional regulator
MPVTPLERQVSWRLHRLAKLTDRASQRAYLAAAGIGLAEARCLSVVGARSPLSVNELAQRANLGKAQASRAAQALVERALVRKAASADDGRGVVLTLTAEGERVWQRVMAAVARRNREITACLSERERAQLDRLLDRLVEAAGEVA